MYDLPDARGHFGPYGGIFVAETLTAALEELRVAYERARQDPAFDAEFRYELKHYVGRPVPIYFAKRLTEKCGGARIYIKREDLNHTGAHKINNTIGQALLARNMSKPPRDRRDRAPACTAWRPRRWPRATAWNASSTWAWRT
jgi:tryptophan synthase beta chain